MLRHIIFLVVAIRDELDGSGSKSTGGVGGEEPAASVAHTLMHMASGEGAGAGSSQEQQAGQQAQAAAAYAGMSLAAAQQAAGLQQVPNAMQAIQMHPGMIQAAGMMMHPAWAAQMMPGTMHAMQQAGMPAGMDMTGGKGIAMDMSSMYYPSMMMQQGYGSYHGMGQ
jgi:hypothetical protein